jgi:choline-sulfatase
MNVVLIVGDRHNPEFAGCYGNSLTRTPHIDSIAGRGTRFDNAYCHSPLCAPSRGAAMSGRYVHEIGTWDNAFPYTGVPRGWAHYFSDQGVHFATVGKLDFEPGADCGVAEEHLGVQRKSLDPHSLFREQGINRRFRHLHRLRAAGPSNKTEEGGRDVQIAKYAARWIAEERPSDRPWVLSVNFNHLHQWNPSQELWNHYDPLVRLEDLDERYTEELSHLHPHHQAWAHRSCGDLIQPEELRRGLVGYHGMCEMMDRNVGRVLKGLEQEGFLEETLVIYASDHGGSCGAHGILDYGSMYNDSIRVLFVAAGPGIRSGAAESTPVSHHDIYATVCEALGLDLPERMRGVSLMGLLRGDPDAPKPEYTLSEFHGDGFPSGIFAIRSGPYKLIECVGERPMLFDLDKDPLEMHDFIQERGDDREVEATVRRLRKILCSICSPEAVDARAKADQRALRQELTESGQIFNEQWRRGYERNPDALIPRPEFVVEEP